MYDSRLFSHSTRCGSSVPVSKVWRSWIIFCRNSSSLIGERLTPTTANSSGRKLAAARLYSAGMSLRLARSPEAPKITSAHGGAGWRSAWACAGGCDWAGCDIGSPLLATSPGLAARRALQVAAELLAHGGEHLLAEGVLLARAEAREQRRREHVGRHRFLERGGDRPAPLPRIVDEAGVAGEVRALGQRHRREVEQPRRDDTAAAPELGDVGEVELEAMPLRQLRRAGVGKDVEALGVGLHQAVLDAVVHHLDEVPGAGGTAMQVSKGGGALLALAARRGRDRSLARRQRLPDRVEALDRVARAADHQAVAAVDAPDAAAGAGVEIVDALARQLACAAHVVLVIRVAAVDHRVAGLEMTGKRADRPLGDLAGGEHQPDRARLLELGDNVGQRRGPHRSLLGQLRHRLRVPVEHHALVSAAQQPPHHVAAHPAQPDHCYLHRRPHLSRPQAGVSCPPPAATVYYRRYRRCRRCPPPGTPAAHRRLAASPTGSEASAPPPAAMLGVL